MDNGLLSNKDTSSRADKNANYFRRIANGVPLLNDIPRAHSFGTVDTNNSGVVIRNNYNVQSVVRNQNGSYTVTMTNALVQNRYAVIATVEGNQTGLGYIITYHISTNKIFNILVNNINGLFDPNAFSFAVYGIAPGPSSPANQTETVIADNGLFTSTDLAATGQQSSSFYLNKNIIVPLPVATAVKAFAYVSNATPSATASVVTIANSFGIDRIQSSNNQINVYRVFFQTPFADNFYNVIATVGGSNTLVIRTQADNPGSFLLIISPANAPTGGVIIATSFYFAVFKN